MFLISLGGSLVLGAGLLATASYSEGTLVAIKTAAQIIGWLFILATVVGLTGLRQATFGRLGAAAITFLSGLAVLYLSHFQWDQIQDQIQGQVPDAPIRHAAAETLPAHEPVYKATLASLQVVMPGAMKEVPPERKPVERETVAAFAAPRAPADRCSEKTWLARVVCQERTRLEYCEGREADEATCPGPTPYSPPG